MKTLEIPVPTFDTIVSLFVGESAEDMKPYFDKGQLGNIDGSNFMGLCFEAKASDGKNRRVVWVREFNHSVLVHELYHAVKYILDFAGVDDHETGAFLIEYLYSESIKLI